MAMKRAQAVLVFDVAATVDERQRHHEIDLRSRLEGRRAAINGVPSSYV